MDDLGKWAKEEIQAARTHSGDWRDEAQEAYDYAAGHQWSDEDKAYLEEQERPVITFNRIKPVLDAVAGSEVSNRHEARFIPRELGDSKVSEVLTGAADWVRDQCDAEDEESDAFYDTITCGMGWTDTRLCYEEDPEGAIIIERTDPLEMLWDPTAKKRNLEDAKWVGRVHTFTRDEFLEEFPDSEDAIHHSQDWRWDEMPIEEHEATEAWKYERDQSGRQLKRNKIRVVEFQYYETKKVRRVLNEESGELEEIGEDRFKKLEEAGFQGRSVRVPKRQYRRAWIVGEHVLRDEENVCEKGFTLNCITGARDRNTNTWFGLVRVMRDPQMWANKFFSQILHIINSNAKGGLLAEEDAFVNPRKAQEDWADPSSITLLKNGALSAGKVQTKQPPALPPALAPMMEFAVSSIRDTSGVNMEMLGLADRSQAGVLEHQRKQAGLTILATLFDSLRRYRKMQGRVLLYMIQTYISDGRLVRLMADGQEQYIPLIRDMTLGTYDIIVDESPTSPNQKQRTFEIMTQMLPILGDRATPEIMMAIMEYSPLPEVVKQKLREAAQKPDPMQEQSQQLEIAQRQADVQETQSKTVLNQAKAQSEGTDPQAQQFKLAEMGAKVQAAMAGAKAKVMGAEADMAKAQMDLAAKRESHAMNRESSLMRHALGIDGMNAKASFAEQQRQARAVGESGDKR